MQSSINMTQEDVDSIQRLSDKNMINRYCYILNYALNNPNSYVSPYFVLTEVEGANPKLLDSIANNLAPEVAQSIYGKALVKKVAAAKKLISHTTELFNKLRGFCF